MKIAISIALLAGASILVAQRSRVRQQDEPVKSAKELADRMDAYYQSQFADLTLAKKGIFGMSRIEMSKIDGHTRTGGDGGYDVPGYSTAVTIYGNHGGKLAENAEDRFHRLPGGVHPGEYLAPLTVPTDEYNRFVKSAIAKVNNGKNGAEFTAGAWTVFARPVRLTKKECLSCHKSAKPGDAVALILFAVGRKQLKRSTP